MSIGKVLIIILVAELIGQIYHQIIIGQHFHEQYSHFGKTVKIAIFNFKIITRIIWSITKFISM